MPDMERECALQQAGYKVVAGIDEAGRGPLAGPVSAAAVILPESFTHDMLDDSKKITSRKREQLYEELTGRRDIMWSLSYAEPEEIDEVNILRATHAAMGRAAQGLVRLPDYCVIDGLPVPGFPIESEGIIKGRQRNTKHLVSHSEFMASLTRLNSMWVCTTPMWWKFVMRSRSQRPQRSQQRTTTSCASLKRRRTR